MTQLATTNRVTAVVNEGDDERTKLIKNTIAKGATDEELELFLYQVKRTGLDPMAKQIYFQKRWNKRANKHEMTIITGIDGYRLIADRTGKYAGNDDPVFDDEDSPRKATVTVYKIVGGIRCPFTASARWDQFYPGDEQGFMWRKMPNHMLGKCAEAIALRKAFPNELSGLYIKEEMDQAGELVTPSEAPAAETEPKPKLITPPTRKPGVYTGEESQQKTFQTIFEKQGVPDSLWDEIHTRMLGKPSTDVFAVIKTVQSEFGV